MPVGASNNLIRDGRPETNMFTQISTLAVQRESNNENASTIVDYNEPHKTMDLPLINIKIFDQEYPCLCDSGSSGNVINETVYLSIKQQNPRLQTLSTCGLFCSVAVGSKRQLIRGQTLLNVEINGKFYELIFMIIPKLTVQIIIGCEAFLQYYAILDFKFKHLSLVNNHEVNTIQFLRQYDSKNANEQLSGQELSHETLFVEMLWLNGRNVAKVGPCNDEYPRELNNDCIVEGYCVNCIDVLNVVHEEVSQVDLAIMNLNIADYSEEDRLQLALKERVKDAQGVTESQRESLLQILVKNKEVFSEKLGLCTSYVHKFTVTDQSP